MSLKGHIELEHPTNSSH